MNKDNRVERVDVIVPIYRGQQYIQGIISQLEACQAEMGRDTRIGLILVNDNPEDDFWENYFSEKIDIIAVGTDRNRGIHGARVRGLLYCTGSYVVFLDQDDRISKNYFKSQLALLGYADAVICRAVNGGREFYDNDRRFEEAVSARNMFSVGNGILSPGQVLIRRERVSEFWRENLLRHNGADDWMLWLCMLYEGRFFSLNQEVLYEHCIDGHNCSANVLGMYESEKEMLGLMENIGYFDAGYLAQLKQAIGKNIEARLRELDRLKVLVDIYDKWLAVGRGANRIAQMLKCAGWHNVAIYGMGKTGLRLYQEIRAEVNVKYFMDRNAAYLKADIPVYSPEDAVPVVDLVIIALIDRGRQIQKDIASRLQIPVIGIEKIIQEIQAEE